MVIDRGFWSYYPTLAAYERGDAPTKGRRMPLEAYAVLPGPDADPRSFYLAPLPGFETHADVPKASRSTKGRLFLLRTAKAEEREAWMECFQVNGARPEAEFLRLGGAPPATASR